MKEIPEYMPVVVETAGWIVTDAKDYITLVSTLSDDKEFTGSVCSIPKGCINSIHNILVQKSESL